MIFDLIAAKILQSNPADEYMHDLVGTKILVTIKNLNLNLLIVLDYDLFTCSKVSPNVDYDISLSGNLNDYIDFIQNKNLNSSKLLFSGCLNKAKKIDYFINNYNLDIEEFIAYVANDDIAVFSTKIYHAAKNFHKRYAQDIEVMVKEYITTEKRLVPSKEEFSYFKDSISDLQLQLDRIEAKVRNFANNQRLY